MSTILLRLTISVPNALKYKVAFDGQFSVSERAYVQIFEGTARENTIGKSKYSGTSFPGMFEIF